MNRQIKNVFLFSFAFCISLYSRYSRAELKSISLTHEATVLEKAFAIKYNQTREEKNLKFFNNLFNINVDRPVEEYANYKYLLIQADDIYWGLDKTIFAKNLPSDMILVVLTERGQESMVKAKFGNALSKDRLIIATHDSAEYGFWARDAFPFPVVDVSGSYGLVAHQYYRPFQGQQAIAQSVKARMNSYDFVFVGGNLMADDEGNCFVIKSDRLYGTSLEMIQKAHGCKTITALPWVSGIGDLDEVVKLLPNRNALTNNDRIKTILQSKGYAVTMLPATSGYRTYANSLIVNGTVFMPSYGTSQDEQAKSIYESFGYKVVKIDSKDSSDRGHGSIHCITMAYPAVDINSLLATQGFSVSPNH